MEMKDLSFDMRAMSGQPSGAYAYVLRMQRGVAGLARASFCRSVASLPNKDQARTGEITGGITGKRTGKKTGKKALFRSVKRLNPMEIFRAEKIAKNAMRLPQRKGPHACRSNTGNSAGRKNPAPKAQAIESAADFGAKKFSRKNPPPGRESLGYREGEGWCAATIACSFSNLLRTAFWSGEGRTLELGGAG